MNYGDKMIYLILFKYLTSDEMITTQSLPILNNLCVSVLDDNLKQLETNHITVCDSKDFSDKEIMGAWTSAINDVITLFKQDEEKRVLIFEDAASFTLFNIMKGKAKLHTKPTHIGNLSKSIDLGDLPFDRRFAVDIVLKKLRGYDYERLIGNGIIEITKRGKRAKNRLSAEKLQYAKKSRPQQVVHTEAQSNEIASYQLKSVLREVTRILESRGKTKDEIMRAELTYICEQYGMHLRFKSGLVYVTTVSGEWYFAYNDRPIKLRHKNHVEKYVSLGKRYDNYHLQNKTFPSPLHVILYIRSHELWLKNHLLNELAEDEYWLSD
jgi:hypothetical protein